MQFPNGPGFLDMPDHLLSFHLRIVNPLFTYRGDGINGSLFFASVSHDVTDSERIS
jgi:hypothetical protein